MLQSPVVLGLLMAYAIVAVVLVLALRWAWMREEPTHRSTIVVPTRGWVAAVIMMALAVVLWPVTAVAITVAMWPPREGKRR